MNASDCRKQIERIFVAFPSYAAYVRKQDNPVATVESWCKMLSACDEVDLATVVDRVLTGESELRHKFDTMDMLPVVLRSKAMRMRDDRNRFLKSQTIVDDSIERRTSAKYKYHLGDLYEQCRKSGRLLRDGKITESENKEVVDVCAAKARELK